MIPVVDVEDLHVRYPVRKGVFGGITGYVRAVDGVNLRIEQGETVAPVGESGCGKSTLGRAILALQQPTSGRVTLRGKDLFGLAPNELQRLRRYAQLVFQNPKSCLDPRRAVGSSVRMALDIQKMLLPSERANAVEAIFAKVGLRPEHQARYPHELSGGQLQRVGIARALILRPDLIVCDEPVLALDVSVQAQILNLLKDIQTELGLAMLFVSHNLAVVEYIADRVAVMYYGRIVETARRGDIFENPQHPYTKALLAAVPSMDIERRDERPPALGDPPDPTRLPTGCRFRNRCSIAYERCAENDPILAEIAPGHEVACFAAAPPMA